MASNKIKTFYRDWKLTATLHTVAGEKDNYRFKIVRLADFEDSLRAGKAEINRREGPQEWDPNYTNQALQKVTK